MSHLENAFRIFGVSANTTRKTIRDLQQSFRTRLKVGAKPSIKDPLAFLSTITLTESSIRDASSLLDNPKKRLEERLLWFTNESSVDQTALNYLQSNQLELAIDKWKAEDQLTAKVNLARLYLFLCKQNSNDLNLWKNTITLWKSFLDDENFWVLFTNWENTSGFEPPATNKDMQEFRKEAWILILNPFESSLSKALLEENALQAHFFLTLLSTIDLPNNLRRKIENATHENILATIKKLTESIISQLNKILRKEKTLLEIRRKTCDQAYQSYKAELLPKLSYYKQVLGADSEILKLIKEAIADCLRKIAISYLNDGENFSIYEKLLKEASNLVPETILAERIDQELSQAMQRRAEFFLKKGQEYYDKEQYLEAAEAYRQAIEIKPDYSEAFFNLGLAYRKLARYLEAIEAFKKAIKFEEGLAEAHFNIAFLYAKLARFSEALPYYLSAIELQPDYPEAHFNLGITYDALGKYEEAVIAYQQAISFIPSYPEAHYQLAIALNKQGNPQEAIKAYLEALRLSPENSRASYNLGLIYTQLKQYQDAIKAFQQAIRQKPNFSEAYSQLALAYEQLEKYQDAISAYQQAICFKPSDSDINFSLAELYFSLSRYQEAINIYKQVILLNSNYWKAHFKLAMSYFYLENYNLALAAYRQALNYKGEDPEINYYLGLVYEKQDRFEDAISCYKQALTLNPNYLIAEEALSRVTQITASISTQFSHYQETTTSIDLQEIDALYETALSQSKEGKYQDAIQNYKKIIFNKPNNTKAYYALATTYNKLGRYEQAIEIYQKLTQIIPNEVTPLYNLGIAYSKAGQNQEALNTYRQAIKLDNSHVDSHFALGVSLSKLKYYKEAVETYKQVLSLKPDHASAYYNLGVAYRNLSRYLEALDNFKQALRYKSTAETHYNLGLVYEKLNRQQYAKEEYQKALKLDPQHRQAQNNLKALDEQLSSYQQAFDFNLPPVNIISPTNRTSNKTDQAKSSPSKHSSKTLEDFKQIASDNIADPMAHYNLGVAYSKVALYQEAIDSYQKSVFLKNDFAPAYFALGVAYTKLKLYQEAIGAYKLAIHNNPNDFNSYFNLATVYRQSDRQVEAIEAYKKAKELKTDQAKVYYGLGLSYVLIEDWHAALEEYKTLKTLSSDLAKELFEQIQQ